MATSASAPSASVAAGRIAKGAQDFAAGTGIACFARDAMLHKMTQAQWREVLEVDLGGCFNMCRCVIEGMRMRTRNYGRIINISSVNALAPGCTDTAMVAAVRPEVLAQVLQAVPAGRLAAPAEIARGVVFLAAQETGFINGITLGINGGKYLG